MGEDVFNLEAIIDIPIVDTRMDCPYCHGKNTLSFTVEASKTFYNCFSARCTTRGYIEKARSIESMKKELRTTIINKCDTIFHLPDSVIFHNIPEDCYSLLNKYNCLNQYKQDMFKIAYDIKQNRLVFLIYDKFNNIIGAVGRSLTPSKSKPKVYIYPGSSLKPYTCGHGRIAVIVEDCFSAIACSRDERLTGIAMLGSSWHIEHCPMLKDYDKVIIAYDKDASRKSLELQKLLQYYNKSVSIRLLEEDIKNLSIEKMVEVLQV